MTQRHQLRKMLIESRNHLATESVSLNTQQLTDHFKENPLFLSAQRIAFYYAIGNELSVAELINRASEFGKQCYLPVLDTNTKTMTFYSYQPGDALVTNRFHIPEPNSNTATAIATTALDLVLVPVVGWDKHGNRLGMGAGYYDRTFAFLLEEERTHKKPWLVGVGHEMQYCAQLDAMPWDVWMIGIATEKKYYEIVSTKQLVTSF
jgi:5-formyltetrahydrofolate cyclo-ligase